VFTAASTPLGRILLGFARLPDARSAVDATGTTTVRLSDVRFMGTPLAPGRGAGSDLFTAVVRIAADGHVIDEKLGR
jgi:hypothetical protein